MTIYDWEVAELIHIYVGKHYEKFISVFIDGEDISELEFVERNFEDFRKWCDDLGYTITLPCR